MHLHLLLFWNTTEGKEAHCMFKATALNMFFRNKSPLPPPRCQLLTVIKNLLSQHCRGNLLLRISLVLVFFTESCNFKGQTIFNLGNDPLFLLLQSDVVFNCEIELNQILKTHIFANSINHSENNIVFEIVCFVRVSLLITL